MKWQRSAGRLLVVAVVLMTVAGAMVPAGAATADSPPQPPQRFFGTVADSSGQSVGGLTVQVTQNGEVVAEDVTDSDGYYDLQVNTSQVNTDEQVTISVLDQSKTRDVSVGGSTQVDFSVTTDTVAGDSAQLGSDGQALLQLGTSGVTSVTLDLGSGTTGTVSARQVSGPPSGVSAPSGISVAVYLDVEAPAGASGTMTVSVASSALSDAGITPEDANLLHYTGGSWETLDTEFVGEAGGEVTLRADVSSFSPFAVAGTQDTGDGDTGDGDTGDGDTGDGDTGDGGTGDGGTGDGGTGDGGTGGGGGDGGSEDETTTTTPPATTTTSPPATTTTSPPATTTTSTTPEPTTTTSGSTDTSTPDGPDDDEDAGGPGPLLIGGVVVVLLGIVGAGYLVYRRE